MEELRKVTDCNNAHVFMRLNDLTRPNNVIEEMVNFYEQTLSLPTFSTPKFERNQLWLQVHLPSVVKWRLETLGTAHGARLGVG